MDDLALIVGLPMIAAGLVWLVWLLVRNDPQNGGHVEVDITGWYQRRWHRKNRQQ